MHSELAVCGNFCAVRICRIQRAPPPSPPRLGPLHPVVAEGGRRGAAAARPGALLPQPRVQHGQLPQLLPLIEILRLLLRTQERETI